MLYHFNSYEDFLKFHQNFKIFFTIQMMFIFINMSSQLNDL